MVKTFFNSNSLLKSKFKEQCKSVYLDMKSKYIGVHLSGFLTVGEGRLQGEERLIASQLFINNNTNDKSIITQIYLVAIGRELRFYLG